MAKKRKAKRQAAKIAAPAKKVLTSDQEFQVFKLVLDKFLWISFAIMLYGVYQITVGADPGTGLVSMGVGILLLLLFVWILVKEYEFIK